MKTDSKTKANCIILLTDFSLNAANALSYAVTLAKAMDASIKMVHALDFSNIVTYEGNPIRIKNETERMKREAETKLKKISNSISRSGVSSDWEVSSGKAFFWLPKYLGKVNPRLVIMASEGEGALKNRGFESFAHRIINQLNSPVLVVPPGSKNSGLKDIVFATNYLIMDVVHLKFLWEIARFYHANIMVLHVSKGSPKDEEELGSLENFKHYVSKTFTYPKLTFRLLHGNDTEERLRIFLKESQVDLLAMSTGKRNFVNRIFRPGLTEKMFNREHSHTPVLAFQDNLDPLVRSGNYKLTGINKSSNE